jgi:two-component system response regulator DegU
VALDPKIKLLLVDDHPLVREGIRSSLLRHPSITIVGEAANGKEALRQAKQFCPDVVLMDLNMPEMNGFEATPLLRKHCPDARIIALTIHDSEEYVFRILRSGASGYLLKDTSPEELVKAIDAVAHGQAYFAPRVATMLLRDVAGKPGSSAPLTFPLSANVNEMSFVLLPKAIPARKLPPGSN